MFRQEPHSPVNGSFHSRKSIYDTELMRILCNWLTRGGWSVTGQWHLKTPDGRHEYSNAVLRKGQNTPIVLEFVATADAKVMRARIEKTMGLVSADAGWVFHLTCEVSVAPTWQTRDELRRGVNVIHVSHKEDFRKITLYSKDVERQTRDIGLS